MPLSDLGKSELARLYGPWAPRHAQDAAALFADYAGQWWVAGGWAIEAFTGVARTHSDLDLNVRRADLPLLRAHLAGRFDLWSASGGALAPVLPGNDPEADAATALPDGCSGVWLRPSGSEPWEFDIQLLDGDDRCWRYRRDPRVSLPWSELGWEQAGVPHLRPEIQLLYKAAGLRPEDRQDFDACLPKLCVPARTWLGEALHLAHPGHPWARVLN